MSLFQMCFFTHFAENYPLVYPYVEHWLEMGKLATGIGMGIDPAPSLAKLFLYFSKSEIFKQLVSLGCSQIYKHVLAKSNSFSN